MEMIYTDYESVRPDMRVGDVLFVGSLLRKPIPIHVAMVFDVKDSRVSVIEGWFWGCRVIPFGELLERLRTRRGDKRLWWVALDVSHERRLSINKSQVDLIGLPYDYSAALKSIWDRKGEKPGDASFEEKDYEEVMCVEVVGKCLEDVGLMPHTANPAEMRAGELLGFPIYAQQYAQLLGDRLELTGFVQ